MLTLCLLAQWSVAQAPKWVDKAKRAVFSVVTYDQNDKILNTGNGFLSLKMALRFLTTPCSKVPGARCDELGRGTDAGGGHYGS